MLTSKDLAELLAEIPSGEIGETAKNPTGRGFQQIRTANSVANYAKLLTEHDLTTSQTLQGSQSSKSVAKLMPEPFLATSQTSQGGTSDADDFWQTLRARIDECDALIHQLCDLRDDDDKHRADLLAVRKRMAPDKLISDVSYLRAEIQRHLIQQDKNKR